MLEIERLIGRDTRAYPKVLLREEESPILFPSGERGKGFLALINQGGGG